MLFYQGDLFTNPLEEYILLCNPIIVLAPEHGFVEITKITLPNPFFRCFRVFTIHNSHAFLGSIWIETSDVDRVGIPLNITIPILSNNVGEYVYEFLIVIIPNYVFNFEELIPSFFQFLWGCYVPSQSKVW